MRWHGPAKLLRIKHLRREREQPEYRRARKRLDGPKPRAAPPRGAAVRCVDVDEAGAGQRLDNFLLRQLKGVPKTLGLPRHPVGRGARQQRARRRRHARRDRRRGARAAGAHRRARRASARRRRRASSRCCSKTSTCSRSTSRPASRCTAARGVSFGVIEQLRRARPRGALSRTGAPARQGNLGRAAGGQEAQRADRAAGPVPRARAPAKTYAALVVGAWPARQKVIDVRAAQVSRRAGERRVRAVDRRRSADGRRSITLVQGGAALRRLHAARRDASRPAARTRSACTSRTPATRSSATRSTATSRCNRQLRARRAPLRAHVPARRAPRLRPSGERRAHRAARRRCPPIAQTLLGQLA